MLVGTDEQRRHSHKVNLGYSPNVPQLTINNQSTKQELGDVDTNDDETEILVTMKERRSDNRDQSKC